MAPMPSLLLRTGVSGARLCTRLPIPSLRFTPQSRTYAVNLSKYNKKPKPVGKYAKPNPAYKPPVPAHEPAPAAKAAAAPKATPIVQSTLRPAPRTIDLSKPDTAPIIRMVPLEQELRAIGEPVLLYQSFNRPFRAMCGTFVALGLAWIGHILYENWMMDMDELAWFVKPVRILGVVLTGVFVATLMFYPSRLILEVRSIPNPTGKGILLQLTKRAFLLPRQQIVTYAPRQLKLSESLKYEVPTAPKELSPNPIIRAFQTSSAQYILTFRWLRELMSTKKFVQVYIDGHMFPLTINKHGWQFERGALEKIIGVRK